MYHPDPEKLIYTINSVLVQREIKPQIVISDDGSLSFDFVKIIEYFEQCGFHDYVICALEKNSGTVKNFNNGIKYCKGEYVKPISPGDILYGAFVLRNWVDFIRANAADVSFANVIYHHFNKKKIVPIKVKAHPQIIDLYYKNLWSYNYLIFDDIVVGAATIVKTEVMREFEGYLKDKVIYADDNAYRLMAYRKKKMCYFDTDAVLYEYGTGMSTSGQKVWSERLDKDWNQANDIILSWIENNEINELTESLRYVAGLHRNGTKFERMLSNVRIGGKLKYQFRKRLMTRYTSSQIDEDYIDLISKY